MNEKVAKAREIKLQKKHAKQRRRELAKAVLAILLILLMIGVAIAPAFSETLPTTNAIALLTPDDYLSDTINSDLMAMLDTDIGATYEIQYGIEDSLSEDDQVEFAFRRMLDYIEANYYKDVDEADLIEGAYAGMFDVLDQHSIYFTQEDYDSFMTNLNGAFSGIGASIQVSTDGYIEIVTPIVDSPSEKAGIKTGDVILAVDGISTSGWSTDKAVSVIRGEKGTNVVLSIRRAGVSAPFDVTIKRDTVVIKTVSYKMLENGVGYIQITQFGENTPAEFKEALDSLIGVDGGKLIVDVRNNPGGYLSTALTLSDYFVDKNKTIVKEVMADDEVQVYRANQAKIPVDIAVLVNGGSASASEIFAGSIQQTGGGVVIGTTTYGKGTVQSPVDFSYAGASKITIAEYLLENDYHVDGVGIIPDVVVDLPTEADYQAYLSFVPMNEKGTKYHGDISLNVYGAQQRLNLLGESLTVDGILGYNTEVALKKFQASHGVTANGRLTQETVSALKIATDSLFDGSEDPILEAGLNYFATH